MAKAKVSLAVGRGEKLPTLQGAGLTASGQIYGEYTRNGLWYVYAHYTVDTNELFYIGMGRYNRCNQKRTRNKYWKRVYDKHGRRIEIVSSNLTQENALEYEKQLIAAFKPRCNLTGGGESGYVTGRKVYAYHKDGSFCKGFASIADANRSFDVLDNDSRIARCLKGERKLFKGFMWRDEKTEKIEAYAKPTAHNVRKAHRYNLEGAFIETINKISDFKEGHRTGISVVLDSDYTYYGSYWRSAKTDTIKVNKKHPALAVSVKVKDTSTGHIYASITKAANSLNCGVETLRRKLTGVRRNNTTMELYHERPN
jgi:hypothetical protein